VQGACQIFPKTKKRDKKDTRVFFCLSFVAVGKQTIADMQSSKEGTSCKIAKEGIIAE
jgi:hypothetical protein